MGGLKLLDVAGKSSNTGGKLHSKMEPQFSRLKNRCFGGIFFWGETLVNVGQILKMNACKTSTGTVIPDLGSARFREFDIEDVMRIFVCFSVS